MFRRPAPKCCGRPLSCAGTPVPPLKGAPIRPSADATVQCQVEMFNGSSWPTLKSRLQESPAVLLCAHEVGTSEAFIGRATAKARSLGWHALFAPSYLNPDTGKKSAGAAVFGGPSIGLRWPPEGGAPIAPHRPMRFLWISLGGPPFRSSRFTSSLRRALAISI
eukprot:2353468-Pyramimonas_sp.AAC.1